MADSEWCLIESDPAVFTELIREFGVKGLQVEELWNLDDDERWQELKPVHGLIFLFKCYAEDYASQKSDSKQTGEAIGQELVDNSDLFFAKQVIQNACATQAIMSILMNMRTDGEDIQLGEMLSEFKSFALALDPASRGLALTNMDRIRDVHNSFARPILFDNESLKERMRKDDDVYHFIAYMPVNGRLYEFDGIRNGAIDHGRIVLGAGGAAEAMDTVETGSASGSASGSGSGSQSVADANSNWLTFARPVLEARIKHIQSIKADELHFSLLAVCADRRVMAERRIESLANELSLCSDELRAAQIANELGREQSLVEAENEKMVRYHLENARRKHNFMPLVVELLKVAAERGVLVDWLNAAQERARKRAADKKSTKVTD